MTFRNALRRFHFVPALFTLALLVSAAQLSAADPQGQAFTSPQKAALALVLASHQPDTAGLLKILGPSAAELITTNDLVADANVRSRFVERAKEKMIVVADPDDPNAKIVEVGYDHWPLPIPLVHSSHGWRFDIEKSKDEILVRRIGDNELTAIDLCRGFAEAQDEYLDRSRATGVRQYAQKIISSPGQRDGLYWPSSSPNDESPMGEIIAHAIAEGYTKKTDPYHGYYFRVLTARGPHAGGGALNYVVKGAMTGGFAILAWPSEYGSTGVMTFVMDRSGIVYQKDLGQGTNTAAPAITAYDPDTTWTPVAGTGVPATTQARNVRK
jgi:hypothetical protein